MNINEAVKKRIQEICDTQDSTICDISLKGGMLPSCIYDLTHNRTKHPKINTIQKFCDGAGITLGQFFTSALFDNLDIED